MRHLQRPLNSLRPLLLILVWLLALLPAGALASIPSNTFNAPALPLASVPSATSVAAGEPVALLTLHLDGLYEGGVLVRQNPWSSFDPEGLALMPNYDPDNATVSEHMKFVGATIIRFPQLMVEKVVQMTENVPVVNKAVEPIAALHPLVGVSETAEQAIEKGPTPGVIAEVVFDKTAGKIPGLKGKGDDIGRLVKEQSGEAFDSARKIVRRFMGKTEMKQLKKTGIPFDPKGGGIPTTTTNFNPKNQDVARGKTGARTAEYQADIDVTGLPQGPTKKTNLGLPEYPIQGDLTRERVVDIKPVRRK